MIDLEKMTVTIGTQVQEILSFETWWVLPTMGMAVTLDQAKAKADETGVPYHVLRPVTVALGKQGLYEVMLC